MIYFKCQKCTDFVEIKKYCGNCGIELDKEFVALEMTKYKKLRNRYQLIGTIGAMLIFFGGMSFVAIMGFKVSTDISDAPDTASSAVIFLVVLFVLGMMISFDYKNHKQTDIRNS